MGRRLPKPFQRPRIEIGSLSRSWQEVSPLQLAVGDIVPDHGRVEGLDASSELTHILVTVRFLSGEVYAWRANDRIRAFTTGDSPWPAAEEYLRGQRE